LFNDILPLARIFISTFAIESTYSAGAHAVGRLDVMPHRTR
jgi:hypothetical protein